MYSTNWKPASARSNFTQSTRLRPKTIRLVHSAAQRALAATTCSSPRMDMMTAQPTSGSHVSSESSGKPAWFMILPEQEEHGDQQHDADQHGEGIGGDGACLDLHHLHRALD